MGKRVFALWRLFAFWVVVFLFGKVLFMVWNIGYFGRKGMVDWGGVIVHGFPLDMSMAGYLCALPALLLLVGVWWRSRWLDVAMTVALVFSAFVAVLAMVVNAVLYEYWGFPLDSTPLFYFFSSPKDAFASVSVRFAVTGALVVVTLTALVAWGAKKCVGRITEARREAAVPSIWDRVGATSLLLLSMGLLFLAIRGGVTVSSMNTGRVYFSADERLNHAAVNPLFSVMESLAHESDFASQYRFMPPEEADALFADMTYAVNDSTELLLNTDRPDVYLVVMESFSSKLMATLGGLQDVAVCLDSLGQEGVLFTHFYANSFRTDRGLVSILSGFPAQPTMSLMKYPHKTAHLPSIAGSLKAAGYGIRYYYGGDADFTHMRSYLVAQGFEEIVSDVDFPVSERLSKWGVPDHLVFERLQADLDREPHDKPVFRVIQTSSSHEPFDVPYHRLENERLNAFAYTDECIGRFVDHLRKSPRWEKSLVVLVPDHLGAYPQEISNLVPERYEIPLIMVGGAVAGHKTVDTVGSQIDIAATLLSQMGIDHGDFVYSKDMMCPRAPHFAFFTMPDGMGMATTDNQLIYDNITSRVVVDEGTEKGANLRKAQAYLQKLYDDIAAR